MKKLIIVIISLFLVTSISNAMGGGGGRNKSSTSAAKAKPIQVLNPGPHLMFTSEGALAFYIDVIPAINEPYDYLPEEGQDPNVASIALGEFDLADGTFEVTIHGNNDVGNSKMITFDLTVKTHGQNRTWAIVPLKEIADQDPEYMNSFDPSSLSITVPKMIKLP